MKNKIYAVVPIPALKDNYIWALINKENNRALIVDPGEAQPVTHFLQQQQLQLAGILITHHHGDHTNGIAGLIQHNVPIFGSAQENISHFTHALTEADVVQVPSFPDFQILSIYGHTRGHIAYYSPGILFCGDTLFSAGCGRIFEGTASQMYASLQKMAALPDNTQVYCAHEYTLNNLRFAEMVEPSNQAIKERVKEVNALRAQQLPSLPSTIGIEKETNPFLRCDSAEIIVNVEKYAQQPLNDVVSIFTWLRKWKDVF